MKNFLLTVGLIVASAVAFYFWNSLQRASREIDNLAEAYQNAIEEGGDKPLEIIKTVVDTSMNKSAATVRPRETTDLSLYVSRGYADTLKKALDIAVKDIDRLQRFTATLQDSIIGLLSIDSSGIHWASMSDNVFDIRYNLDSNVFYPKVTLDLSVISHPYRPRFFARRQLVTTIMANDKRVDIGNIRQVNKITLPSRFGLDVTFGAVMTPHGLTYGVGAGLGYRIKEF